MENKQKSSTQRREPQVRVKEKTSRGAVATIITLSILLGVSLLLGITSAFFTANQTAQGTITLGDPVNINITQGGATVTSLTFDGTALPGTEYAQPIGVTLPSNTSDAVIRGKLTITNTDNATVNVDATTSENWTLGEDGYHYYNGKMSAGESQSFVTAITVPTSLTNTDANKTYAINIQIEAIQFANGAAAEVWTTAPESWITAYGSGTIAG